MRKEQTKTIAINNIEPALEKRINEFMANHRRIPSYSQVAKAALEMYIGQANRYGIDGEWRPRLPEIPIEIYDLPVLASLDAPKGEEVFHEGYTS